MTNRSSKGLNFASGCPVHSLVGTKKSQGPLQESSQKDQAIYQAILDTVVDAIITIDEEGIVQAFNRAAERIFGYQASEIIGQKINKLMLDPYRNEHDQYMQNYYKTGKAKIIGIGREITARKKDGSVFPIYLGVSEVWVGKRRFFTGIIRDITQTKEYEEELKKQHEFIAAVLDTVGALVVVFDRIGRIVSFNHSCEEITGYTAKEVQGKFFWDLFLPKDEVAQIKSVFGRIVSGQFPNQYENIWLTKERKRHLIAWSNTALTDPKGRVEFIIATGIDVTERRQMEKTILEITKREQQRIGEELHDNLGQHLVSTAVTGKLLEKKLSRASSPMAKDASRLVELVNQAVMRTRELAQGLYSLEMPSDGLVTSLKKFASETEEMFQISCVFRCDPSIVASDPSTATHLYRIARESVNNAVKHGRPRKISIHLNKIDEEKVELRVENDGLKFKTPRAEYEGMGLRIMKSRANIIGALLKVNPRPRGGTVVTCEFRNG